MPPPTDGLAGSKHSAPQAPHHLNRALWCVPCVAWASSLAVPVPVPDALQSRITHPGQCRLCRAPGAGKRPVCTLPGLQKIPDAAAQRWHKQKTIGIVDDKRRARKTTRLSASSPLTRPPTDRRAPLKPGPRAPHRLFHGPVLTLIAFSISHIYRVSRTALGDTDSPVAFPLIRGYPCLTVTAPATASPSETKPPAETPIPSHSPRTDSRSRISARLSLLHTIDAIHSVLDQERNTPATPISSDPSESPAPASLSPERLRARLPKNVGSSTNSAAFTAPVSRLPVGRISLLPARTPTVEILPPRPSDAPPS